MGKHAPNIHFLDIHARAEGLRARFEPLQVHLPLAVEAVEDIDDLRRRCRLAAEAMAEARAVCEGQAFLAYLEAAKEAWVETTRAELLAKLEAVGLGGEPLPAIEIPKKVPAIGDDGRQLLDGEGRPRFETFREAVHHAVCRDRSAKELAACQLRIKATEELNRLQATLTRDEVFRLEADLALAEARRAQAEKEKEDQAREARLRYKAPPRPVVLTGIGRAAKQERSDIRAAREAEEAAKAAQRAAREAEEAAKARTRAVQAALAEAMKAATLAVLG